MTKKELEDLTDDICAPVKHNLDDEAYAEWRDAVLMRLRREMS